MKTYQVHYYKTRNLSPGELDCVRRGALGLWLFGDLIQAKSGRAACSQYRKSGQVGSKAGKLRAV